jgi:bacterioferritin-associated ferredoxin
VITSSAFFPPLKNHQKKSGAFSNTSINKFFMGPIGIACAKCGNLLKKVLKKKLF